MSELVVLPPNLTAKALDVKSRVSMDWGYIKPYFSNMAATRLLAQETRFKVMPFQQQDFLDGSTWPTSMGKPRFSSALVYMQDKSWCRVNMINPCWDHPSGISLWPVRQGCHKEVSLLSSGTMHDAVRKVVHSLKQDGDIGCKWHTYNFMWITWWLVGEGVLELLEAQVWQESDTQVMAVLWRVVKLALEGDKKSIKNVPWYHNQFSGGDSSCWRCKTNHR